jgi:hypothetical protein
MKQRKPRPSKGRACPGQGSISLTFYEQFLRAQISKAQKKLLNLTVFLVLLGFACVKGAHGMLVKLTPD